MDLYDKVIELSKRRGFLWNSFEIYGGAAGFYDYGPYGAMLKRCVENIWRDFFVVQEGFFEIESPTIGIEDIFVASGHVSGFSDPITECLKCGEVFRADHLINNIVSGADGLSSDELERLIKLHNTRCPECGGNLDKVYDFNLMFNTSIGSGAGRKAYLRPETAQGMFVDFPRLLRFYREKLPFGATQIGKAYRNEISPRQGVLRLREFTQAEAEIFIDPVDKTHPCFKEIAKKKLTLYPANVQEEGDEPITMQLDEAVSSGIIAHECIAYYINLTCEFLVACGIDSHRLRLRQHRSDEMAHYAADCWDAEVYLDRFGWVEVVGIADRTDYDLKAHMKLSQAQLTVFKEYKTAQNKDVVKIKPNMAYIGPTFKNKAREIINALQNISQGDIKNGTVAVNVNGETITLGSEAFTIERRVEEIRGENVVPHVIEPSFGIDRIIYAILEHSYFEEMVEDEIRVVLKLPMKIAPVKAAVLPLLTRNELIEPANRIVSLLKKIGIQTVFDDSGTIGRRYRRNDEIGTPYAITIDYETLKDGTVTIRDRDTMKQVRVPIKGIDLKISNALTQVPSL